MKISKIGQEKGDLLIQVTAWAGLTIYIYCLFPCFYIDTRAYLQCMNGCGYFYNLYSYSCLSFLLSSNV
jgi:hypothetical protein